MAELIEKKMPRDWTPWRCRRAFCKQIDSQNLQRFERGPLRNRRKCEHQVWLHRHLRSREAQLFVWLGSYEILHWTSLQRLDEPHDFPRCQRPPRATARGLEAVEYFACSQRVSSIKKWSSASFAHCLFSQKSFTARTLSFQSGERKWDRNWGGGVAKNCFGVWIFDSRKTEALVLEARQRKKHSRKLVASKPMVCRHT